jgi:hypothetical protein
VKRRWLARISGFVWIIWFTTLVVDPMAMRGCPIHDPAVANASATGHMAGVAHAEHGARHSHTPSEGQCGCHDGCCVGAQAIASPTPVLRFVEVAVAVHEPTAVPAAYQPAPVAYRLPFANGPPGATRA